MRALRLALSLILLAPLAHACSIIGGARFETSLWHRITDHRAPTPPAIRSGPVELHRGIGPLVSGDGSMFSTSCDDVGLFDVRLTPSIDSRTLQAEIGYEVELTSGEAPVGMFEERPQTLVSARPGTEPSPRLGFVWVDGATDVQEPIDVRFVLRAVDRAGNRSAPSDTVHVVHPGFAPGAARRNAEGERLG